MSKYRRAFLYPIHPQLLHPRRARARRRTRASRSAQEKQYIYPEVNVSKQDDHPVNISQYSISNQFFEDNQFVQTKHNRSLYHVGALRSTEKTGSDELTRNCTCAEPKEDDSAMVSESRKCYEDAKASNG